MRNFEAPKMNISRFTATDVVTTSGGTESYGANETAARDALSRTLGADISESNTFVFDMGA